MVVLDSNYAMLSNTSNENHYIIPDSVPLPASLDAKNSPLALLAQTCSQIGADSSNPKPMLSSMERNKKPSSTSSNSSSNTDRSSSASQQNQTPHFKSERKSPETKLAFKPYEQNVLTRKSDSTRPPSGHADVESKSSSSRASSRKSASASPHNTSTVSPHNDSNKSSTSPVAVSTAATNESSSKPSTPIEARTRSPSKTSSAETFYSNSLKESAASSFKSPFILNGLGNVGCNGCPTLPGLIDTTNPAFRSFFANPAHLPHPSLIDAACLQSSTPSPYLNYHSRVKTPSGGDAVVPAYCKDPFCLGGCSRPSFPLHGVGPCPPGCVQCEPKYNATAAAMLMSPFANYQYGRPFICNWISGEQYCGKRFRTSDELLQHLRTHTSTTDPVALMNSMRYPVGATNHLAAAASAAAAARYHPYSKAGLPALPFAAFNPTPGPYYSPYSSLYDQRIGAAVNP